MKSIGKFQLILIAALVIALLYFISNAGYKKVDTKDEMISFCKSNQDRFLQLEGIFVQCGLSDSGFYAEHRSREDKFHFFSLIGTQLDTPFQLAPEKYDTFKNAALAVNIEKIWKYSDDNFYTFVIRGMEKLDDKKVFVLVLKKEASKFMSVDDTRVTPIGNRISIELTD